MDEKQGTGAAVSTVRNVETPYGLAFYQALKSLPAGLHGFHVHENASCAPTEKDGVVAPAGAAGVHLDPMGSKRHGEPWATGTWATYRRSTSAPMASPPSPCSGLG